MTVATDKILFLSLLLLTFFCLISASADDILLPEEEAAGTFIDITADSDDVLLFLTGSWKIDLSASTGFGWSAENGMDFTTSYSGMETGVTFVQTPDFTASLTILDRFLFEAAFTDEFDDSTFRLGYQGQEGEFLQTISLGNMGINLSDDSEATDFFYIPDGGSSSFGLYSYFEGTGSSHELLLRFDPDMATEKVYIGSYSVTEIELEASGYMRERFYYLPGIPSDVIFYIETDSDSAEITYTNGEMVRSFEKITAENYSYSTSTGMLYLESAPDGMLLASSDNLDWTSAVSNDYMSSDLTLSDFSISTSGGDMLVLSDKGDIILPEEGEFSPFESAAAYSTGTVIPDESWQTRVYLAPDADSTDSAIELDVSLMNDEGIITLNPAGTGEKKYPLNSITSDLSSIYGPHSLEADDNNYLKIIVVIKEEETSYTLDDPIEGTVRIYINGQENFDWTLSGSTITFDTDPGENDRIEITYRKEDSGTTGGDLLFATANRFTVTDDLSAAVNAGLRWNVFSGTYSYPGEENPGYINASASLNYENSSADSDIEISAALDAGLRVECENAAGALILKNMSGGSLAIALSGDTVFPSSPSAYLSSALGLDNDDRGILYYKNYWTGTGYLQDYNADLDDSAVYSPADSTPGSQYKAGPYTAAAAKDDKSGEVLVMDYLLPEEDSWAGIQIPVSWGSENTDLSAYNAVSFDCKTEGDLSGVEFYLEIGTISEDLDADGILDAESSKYSGGYTFNDPSADGGTLIGTNYDGESNDILDTEDVNGNGFIDTGKSDETVVFSTAASDFTMPGSSWTRVRLYFDESGLAGRSKLKNAEFIRLIAVNTESGEQSGRILIDDINIEGSSLFTDDDFTEPAFSEITESLISSSEAPSSSLSCSYMSGDDDNKAMRVSWDSPWQLYSVLTPVEYNDYESILFYIHVPDLSNSPSNTSELAFRMVNSGGEGITASIPIKETSTWREIEIKPSAGEIYIDDELSTAAVLSVDADAGSLVRMEIEVDDSSEGVIYIDEIHLLNPALNTTAGVTAEFSISSGTALLSVGDFEIIGASSTYSNLSYTAVEEDAMVSDLDLYSKIDSSLLGIDISADLSWNNITGTSMLAGSHDLNIPLIGSHLSVTDSFQADDAGGGDFSKSNYLSLNAGPVSGCLAGFSASWDSGLLTQKWTSALSADAGLFKIDMDVDMLLSGTGYTGDWENYFAGWLSGTMLGGVFSNSGLSERGSSFSLSPALSAAPVGLSADLELGTGLEDSDYFDNAKLELKLPMSFENGTDKISAEIGYSRKAEYTNAKTYSAGFTDDISGFFSVISGRSYLFTSIPAVELFSSDLNTIFAADCLNAGIEEAELENSIYLNISRDYSSRLLDLFLPYSVKAEVGRTLVQDFSETEDDLDFTISCSTAALNLFGAVGVYRLFDFYYSDEFDWSLDVVFSRDTDQTIDIEYYIDTGITVFGHEDQSFSFSNDIYLPFGSTDNTWTLESNLLYIWNYTPEIPVDLPLFTDEEEDLQIFTNEEKLTAIYNSTFSTEIKHTTSLIIPQTLTLSAFGKIGFELDTISENNMFLFGFSAGISASILY